MHSITCIPCGADVGISKVGATPIGIWNAVSWSVSNISILGYIVYEYSTCIVYIV